MNHESHPVISRRSLMRGAAAISAGCVVAPNFTNSAQAATKPTLNSGDVILFQGDSITDAGRARDRSGANDPRGLGAGYPTMIASRLLGVHAALKLQCYNRGISGNKVPDLDARWQADAVDLQPAVLSILIGVNDIWHKLNGNYDGSVQDYEDGFNALVERTVKALPKTRIVVCEPFVLRCGAVNDKWFPEFDQRRDAAKRVAQRFDATWVPFQTMFDDATSEDTPPSYWAGDGVHPTTAGHALMAKTWLDTTGLS